MSSYRCPLIVVGVGAGFIVVGAVPVVVSFSIGARTSATIIGMGFVGFGVLLLVPGLVWCVAVRALHGFKQWRRRSMRRQQSRSQSAVSAVGGVCGTGDVTEELDGDGCVGGGDGSIGGGGRDGTDAGGLSAGHGALYGGTGRPRSAGTSTSYDGHNPRECDGDQSGAVQRSGSRTDERRHQRRNRSWPSSYSEPPTLIVTDHLVCNASSVPRPSPSANDDDQQQQQQQQQSSDTQSPSIQLVSTQSSVNNDVFADVIVCDVIIDKFTTSSLSSSPPDVARSAATSGDVDVDIVRSAAVGNDVAVAPVVETETGSRLAGDECGSADGRRRQFAATARSDCSWAVRTSETHLVTTNDADVESGIVAMTTATLIEDDV